MIKKIILTVAVVCICGTGARADFVAYNDFGGTTGGNTTAITLGQFGLLKNYDTAANTSVTINVVAGSPAPATDAASGSTPTGGDAFTIFNGKINMTGYIWYNNVVTVPYSSVRLDFTGLDPNKSYEIVLSGNRNNTAYQGVDARYTRFTISDVSTFTNTHSSGTTVVTVTQTNDSVNVSTGYNTVNGHVARWSGVRSGVDGDFSVNVTAPTATGGGGDAKWYLGALRLTETSAYDYQDGLNGYTGTVDTFLQQVNPNMNHSSTTPLKWDNDDGGAGFDDYPLIRFDNIFGTGPGQIQPTDTITSATLFYNVGGDANATGNNATYHEVLVNWSESDTFNTFGGEPDVQPDEYGPSLGTAPGGTLGVVSVDVTSSITAWKTTPANNRGWMFRPTGSDGVQISSREHGTVGLRPRLSVLVNAGVPAQKTLVIKHQPYLQLGNAPLVSTGAGIGTTDQMVITWQTIESGSGSSPNDYFEASYRPVGGGSYIPVSPVSTINTAVGTRVNHYVTITGLNYDSDFEYQVVHKRNPSSPIVINTYPGTFRTRKHPSSTDSFTFATYGDSADKYTGELPAFESVAARVAASNAAFVMLLGDNTYPNGTHDDMDGRLEGAIVPNNSAYIRNHIEYLCIGNHESYANSAQASLDNYFCPIPLLGVTSPVAPAAGETPEKNYSFDYGSVHFTVIDSCAWGDPGISVSRQAAIANWMAADLAASNQPWKFLIAHHPPKSWFGHSDTPEAMACEVIPRAIANGADLLFVGHSHNYQRSFPITSHSAYPGCSGGDVTYIADQSGAYIKGAQLIELLVGTGGKNISNDAPTSAIQWLAKGFGTNNGGGVGPMIVDVTASQLTLKYTRASNGAILDQITVSMPGPAIALSPTTINRTVFLGDNLPDDSFNVSNGGINTINYSINDDAAWLSTNPTSGSSTGELDPITVSYTVTTLPVGNHSATITVTAPEAANSPKTVQVNVTVESVRPDLDGDGDVDQDDFAHLQECFSGTGLPFGPGCADADLDVNPDGDVDAADLTVFLNCHMGANVMAIRTCDD